MGVKSICSRVYNRACSIINEQRDKKSDATYCRYRI